MSDKQIIITVAGPSTSGKSTLANLFKDLGYSEIVSTTTRPQRTGEIDGVHYHFVDQAKFDEMVKTEQLVENAPVGQYWYGVSKAAIAQVLESGKSAILVLEPTGANNVATFCQEQSLINHKVFLNNPVELLLSRLFERFENDNNAKVEVYKDRLRNIKYIEPKEWTAKAYSGEHFYDQIFDSFNLDNQENVISSILSEVEKKLTNKNNNKRKI